ncbi:MAG: hypothetical protein P4L35_17100, partial [Ignavibacteriaceae bacterium]|nr:hypothetical protein [Ignavibacteriaceae bacterium]
SNCIAQKNILNGVCPLCGRNKSTISSLEIGYRRKFWNILSYNIIYIKYSVNAQQITSKINICTSCKNNYLLLSRFKILTIFKINPSIKVLKRKLGYLRGLRFPYAKWHVS